MYFDLPFQFPHRADLLKMDLLKIAAVGMARKLKREI